MKLQLLAESSKLSNIVQTFLSLSRHSPITAPPLPGNLTADPYYKKAVVNNFTLCGVMHV